MKKLLFFIVFMLVTTIAQAENTSWIKGGLSFFDGETFCTANNPIFDNDTTGTRCGNNFEGKSFFIQVSPINFRGKFDGSKLGYRFEPWMGYSQTGKTDAESDIEGQLSNNGVVVVFTDTELTDLSVKNFQFGTNLFLDFEVLPNLTIYGGPVAGFEISQISAEVTQYGNVLDVTTGEYVEEIIEGYHSQSEWVSNFIYGAEIGGEYKITKTLALGAFAGFLQHGAMFDGESESKWNQDTEIRAGTGLTFYW